MKNRNVQKLEECKGKDPVSHDRVSFWIAPAKNVISTQRAHSAMSDALRQKNKNKTTSKS